MSKTEVTYYRILYLDLEMLGYNKAVQTLDFLAA